MYVQTYNIQKYLISSLIGLMSMKMSNAITSPNSDQRQNKLREFIEQFLTNPQLNKSTQKETHLFESYLKTNAINLNQQMKLKDVRRLVKKYQKEQYLIKGNVFDSVRPVIDKIYETIKKTDLIK